MIAIVDCNSFYCSCERVFRPDLAQKPVVVLSNNDGCIISRTDEAKALGVGMAGPYFQAKPLIEAHGVQVFSSNYYLYGDMSRRVMDILKTLAGEEQVEVYSVDEAFLNLEGFSYNQLSQLAETIRDTINRWTGINVSIGIATTKTLAKMANRLAKSNKAATSCIMMLDSDEKTIRALKQTPISDVWGIGSRYANKLTSLGIDTAWDLRNLPQEWARKHLGGVTGMRLIKELKGEPSLGLKEELISKKMITTSRMFGAAVTKQEDITQAIATYVSRAAEKLRRQHSAAGVISIYLTRQEPANAQHAKQSLTTSAYIILPQPTALTNELIKPAIKMAEQLFEQGKKYKKAGVVLSDLVPDHSIQANMFEPGKGIGRFLMEMMDNINFGMRGNLVKFAAAGTSQPWQMRQQFHSPRYTTRWDELCMVK